MVISYSSWWQLCEWKKQEEMKFNIVIFIFVVKWARDNIVLLNGDKSEKIFVYCLIKLFRI
jgi:hypothetical protein